MIDEEALKKIKLNLNTAIKAEEGELHIAIDSHGGELRTAQIIMEMLLNAPIPICTYNIGKVESAAVIVFRGGNKRLVTPGATFMIHAPKRPFAGTPTKLQLQEIQSSLKSDADRLWGFFEKCFACDCEPFKNDYY